MGSDEVVAALTDRECSVGVDLLCRKSIAASIAGDATAERLSQKQLARALLRWSVVSRAARLEAQTAETPMPNASSPTMLVSEGGAEPN